MSDSNSLANNGGRTLRSSWWLPDCFMAPNMSVLAQRVESSHEMLGPPLPFALQIAALDSLEATEL